MAVDYRLMPCCLRAGVSQVFRVKHWVEIPTLREIMWWGAFMYGMELERRERRRLRRKQRVEKPPRRRKDA